MNKDLTNELHTETSRLLAELDIVLDQSSVMRDIVDKTERLHNIESIAGTSCRTRDLRKEIESIERTLGVERCQHHLVTDAN